MKTIKVAEASGPALDWLVAKCEEATDKRVTVIRREDYIGHPIERETEPGSYVWEWWSPSRIWSQGGPIIEREQLQINAAHHNDSCAVVPMAPRYGFKESVGWHWEAYVLSEHNIDETHQCVGQTPLVAAMRCYVTSKLGETVEVSEELA